jgi:hypothetical protein
MRKRLSIGCFVALAITLTAWASYWIAATLTKEDC